MIRFASHLAALAMTALLALPASAQAVVGGPYMDPQPGACASLNAEIEQATQTSYDFRYCRHDAALLPIQQHAWGQDLARLNINHFWRVGGTLFLLHDPYEYAVRRMTSDGVDHPSIWWLTRIFTDQPSQHDYHRLVIIAADGKSAEFVDLRSKPSQ